MMLADGNKRSWISSIDVTQKKIGASNFSEYWIK